MVVPIEEISFFEQEKRKEILYEYSRFYGFSPPRLKQMNQSRQYIFGSLVSIRCLATPHDPGGGIITSSPGCQFAGVAIPSLSDFCIAMRSLLISCIFRPLLRG